MTRPITEDIIERAQTLYADRLRAVRAYVGPQPPGAPPVSRDKADEAIAAMTPADVAGIAATDPSAAAQIGQRLDIIDQRASGQADYPDDYEPGA